MAHFLHRLGAFAFGHPWRVIGVWVVLLAVLGFTASQFIKPTSSDISIPGTQAQAAIDRASEVFPESGKGSGRIVFQTHGGKKIADYGEAIAALTKEVAEIEGVTTVVSPLETPSFVAASGDIAYAQVQLEESTGETEPASFDAIAAAVDKARGDGLQVEMSQSLSEQGVGEILGIGEVVGVLVALLVLVITLGSLIAAGLPLISAIVGIGVSMAALFSMSQLFTISSTTPVLAVMLGLAVGIDYSLFIINKFRTYALEGYGLKDAAARAAGTAGNAVVFAALTVIIALAALTIVNIPFMTTMGLAGAGSIAIAALVSITLVPALLGVAGRFVFGKKARQAVEKAQQRGIDKVERISHRSVWYRWGSFITRRPIIVLVVALAVLGVMALPAKDMKLGLPTDQYAAVETTERKAYDILSEGFGVGFNGPLTVLVENLPAVTDEDRAAAQQMILAQYAEQAGVMGAASPEAQAQLMQMVEQYARLVQLNKVAERIGELDNVDQAFPATATDNGTIGIIQVIPESAPADKQTAELITTLRDEDGWKQLTQNDAVTLAVTGTTALEIDISDKLAAALPQYLAVVVGLSLILLIVAFRSIVVPIKATLGFLLSVLAMFGALVAVFQWGWFGIAEAPGLIVSFIPIIAIGILFGLAMDYEFFLVSSMHEVYSQTKDAKKAVVRGFAMGAKVVTAAGVIMVSVFAGFITNHDATIQAMGFGLAIGILVDAFIVRMTIVPAVMSLLGKRAWWLPKWLDKRLPHVSIEGEAK